VKSIALVQFQISNESSLWWHVNYVMDYYHEKKQELECMYEQVEAQPVSWVVHDKTAYSISRPLVAYKSTVPVIRFPPNLLLQPIRGSQLKCQQWPQEPELAGR